MKNQFEPLRTNQWINQNLTYDFDSIMHYSSKAGVKGTHPSLTKLDGTEIGINDELSRGDVDMLNLFYPCKCQKNNNLLDCTIPTQQGPLCGQKPVKQLKSGSQTAQPSDLENLAYTEQFPLSAPECYHPAGSSMKWTPKSEEIVRIVGGQLAKARHPYMASIQAKGFNLHKCGGSIIHKRFILTAAHCFHEKNSKSTPDPDQYEIYLGAMEIGGERKLGEAGIAYAIEKIHCHEDYSFRVDDSLKSQQIKIINDICLIKLDKEIEFNESIWPICLPDDLPLTERETKMGQMCTVAGWGYTKYEVGGIDGHLREVDVPLVPYQKCHDFYKE